MMPLHYSFVYINVDDVSVYLYVEVDLIVTVKVVNPLYDRGMSFVVDRFWNLYARFPDLSLRSLLLRLLLMAVFRYMI